ncbi:hypothetical protein RAS2_15100 [Phycisphaerae bacterium RAS2]|nr:hypothetical protein RAS2_15100 [Phycisphaerae bacterium RAS2]
MKINQLFAAAVCLGLPSAALATPVQFTVNPGLSNVNVQLCIQGSCDSDPSSVSGFMSAKTLPVPAPAEVTLYDYQFTLNDQIDLFISFSIFGNFTGTGQNINLLYATPGVPQPPATVLGNAFSIPGVPTNQTGTFTYNATGIVCTLLQGQVPPIPCNGAVNLADQGTQSGDLSGTLAVVGRTVTLTSNPNVSVPLDPANPSLGSLTVTGTIVASATIPLRGDVNLSGGVNGLDVQEFTRVMLNPGGFTWQKRFATDMNDDDAFDATDVAMFVDCLVNANCPD